MRFLKNMNLPNKLTLFRVILIPVFIVLLYEGEKQSLCRWTALAVFVIACLTDTADGYIARSRKLITNFGKFMDPLADKLLVCSALICFIDMDKIAAWPVILIIAREFIISGFRLVASDKGVVIAAGIWGKLKTVCQMLTCIILIADIEKLKVLGDIFVYVTVALTFISLVDYIVRNKEVLSD